jgi:hypothetical protein
MKDFMLESLIILSEMKTPIEHDVTLLVGGFLVSGFVISYKKYIEHHQTMKFIDSAIEKINARNPEALDESPEFIHLRDAKFYFPGANPIPGNMSIYVRIPLESVHGFSFGKLEFKKN